MPTTNSGGRFVWGSAFGSSPGGAMPTMNNGGRFVCARPLARAQEEQRPVQQHWAFVLWASAPGKAESPRLTVWAFRHPEPRARLAQPVMRELVTAGNTWQSHDR